MRRLLVDPLVTSQERAALRLVAKQARAWPVVTFDREEWRTLARLERDRDPSGARGLRRLVVRQERRDCWLVTAAPVAAC